ncbi:secreted RxLR effector peptide protein, putative [Phytophthora infestans T30-4]|uniref:Secreted RxLR effector peptide protein, putative n=1 Tax=Phytophthora infestans (strain T30-4) TaxID=403677 RepID=D0NTL2_PHYIT|nr:secreted RxLR effector peptide protein, putative [Phytophthora infestans T30-4]EEY64974.1 secreted RxLR effector peptide protein, putative [Phytophthora infestans T30-4]|eukprot:XP_002897462.1 secreted RxLR effector peptide protein, putative [Phytophthora infestans T30-4]
MLLAAAIVFLHIPALTMPAAEARQTAANIMYPVLDGEQNFLGKRSLRTDHMRVSNVEDREGDEERIFRRFTDWIKYLFNKMNPKQLHIYLGLDGLGETAYQHKNYPIYLMKSKKWRDKL